MIRVMIAEGSPLVREGLKQEIIRAIGVEVVGEVSNSKQLVHHVQAKAFDVVLLDLAISETCGVKMVRELKRIDPQLSVLILSPYVRPYHVFRLLRNGVAGYLPKQVEPKQVIKAIRATGHGERYISPKVAQRLVLDLGMGLEQPPHERLSEREFQVLCHIAWGSQRSEIAEKLSISPQTVSTYRSRILKKLALRNDAEITRYALLHKLVE